MSEESCPSTDALPLSLAERVDKVCDRFEAVWKNAQTVEQRPRIEDYLDTAEEPERSVLLHELIVLDIDYRRQAGEQPRAEEYGARFPFFDLAQVASVLAVQTAAGPDVAAAASAVQTHDFRRREPPLRIQGIRIRCPHCHNPIQILDDRPDEVLCPGCGSSFRLREARQTSTTDTMRPLGKFQLLERVGLGAFGAVWRARDTELDRIVALKIPHASLLASHADLERFHREARAAAQLRHPGIVTVHEVQTLEGLPTIVSDYIDGMPLRDLLEVRRLTFRETAALVAEVAEAVDYAHSMGLVHRDLKPANIMMESVVRSPSPVATEQGSATADSGLPTTDFGLKPLVMDFGLALRQEAEITLTLDGHILGTPAYMSPEQAAGKGHQADRRSDVYSLGVILYELLCGELPFRGSRMMMLHQVQREEPRPPRRLNDKIPRDLETICLKAMAKIPARRYGTAREMAEDLRRFLRGEPIKARRVGQVERLWRWCQRNPAVAGLLLAVMLSLLSGTILASFFALRATANAAEARENEQRARDEKSRADRKALEAEENASLAQENEKIALAQKLKADVARKQAEKEKQRAEEQRERAERLLYAGQIALAQREWQDNEVAHAQELLYACRSDLRGWEHAYLCRLVYGIQHTLYGHTAPVRSVTFSPDGKRIVSESWDSTLIVWDAQTGQEILTLRRHPQWTLDLTIGSTLTPTPTLKGHTALVRSVAFSPDGKRIVGSSEKMLKVWDAQTGQETLTLKGHTALVRSVAFSPDGKRIVSGSDDRTLKVWDAQTGQETFTLQGHTHSVRNLGFSPDGKRIVGNLDRTLKVWDAQTGQDTLTLTGHTAPVRSVAFSPDGKRIVSECDDNTLKVWDAQTGKQILTLQGEGHTDPAFRNLSTAFSLDGIQFEEESTDWILKVWSLPLSPDGKCLVRGSPDRTLKVWNTQTGQQILDLQGHTEAVTSWAFSPDGKRILSGSKDGTLKVWDVQTGQDTLTLTGHNGPVSSVAYSPDGKHIVSGSDDSTLKVWDAQTGQLTFTLKGHTARVTSVAFSPDGKRIVSGSGDSTVMIWDAQTGQESTTLTGHADRVHSVTYSPDGKRIVSGSKDGTLKVWDAQTGQETLTLEGHTDPVLSVAYSPDGKHIVSGSDDNTLKVWDAQTGQETFTLKGHTGPVLSVAYSPDGKHIVSGSDDNTLKVWDAQTGQETFTLKGHTGPVLSVAYSPDGKHIVSGSKDGTLKVWDRPRRQVTRTLKGHTADVSSVAFSPDGKRVVSGSWDNTLKVWDAQSGQQILTFQGHTEPIWSVVFSPDGKRIVSGSWDRRVKVWDAQSGQETLTLKGHTSPVSSLAFSPDGKRIVSGSWDRTVKLWDAQTGPLISAPKRAPPGRDGASKRNR